jgi:hypothetical protein
MDQFTFDLLSMWAIMASQNLKYSTLSMIQHEVQTHYIWAKHPTKDQPIDPLEALIPSSSKSLLILYILFYFLTPVQQILWSYLTKLSNPKSWKQKKKLSIRARKPRCLASSLSYTCPFPNTKHTILHQQLLNHLHHNQIITKTTLHHQHLIWTPVHH